MQAAVAAFTKLLKPGADLAIPQTLDVKLGTVAAGRWGGWFTQTLDAGWVTSQQKILRILVQAGTRSLLADVHVGQQYA